MTLIILQNMYKIYSLIDPNTNEVRYIGVTTKGLNTRLSQHIYESKYEVDDTKRNWINSLINENKKPIISLIEETNDWKEREKFWISQYSNLVNVREGGSGLVLNRSKESIQLSAEAHELAIIQLSINNEIINTFDSISKAQKATNISRTNIGNVLAKRAVTAGGYHWIYKKDYTPDYKVTIINEASLFGSRFSRKSIIATVNNTEILFNSVNDCATYFKVSQPMISAVLKGTRKLKNATLRYSLI